MINPLLMTKIRNDLDRWETPVLWMYLDSVGLVTVGCGTMLPDTTSAKKIKFFHDKTLLPATAAEIEAAWNKLHLGANAQKAAPPKKKFAALHYKKETDLRITIHTSSTLRDSHVEADYRQLKQIYPKFDEFPENAKLALFDMVYNLGPGKSKARHHRSTGLRHYILMNAAINKEDWESAALHCSRHGIPIERNRMTAALFRSCVVKRVVIPKTAVYA